MEETPPEEIQVEFDEFSKIKNEVSNNNDENHIDNNDVVDTIVEVKEVKPRKPRASKKTIVVEDVKPIEASTDEEVRHPFLQNLIDNCKKEEPPKVNEDEVIPEIPEKKIRTQELVKCERCNKEMTKKTLRYFHEKTCPGIVVDKETLPVKKRNVKKDNNENVNNINIPNEIIENEVKKRIENTYKQRMADKMKQKEERIKKLATQIA